MESQLQNPEWKLSIEPWHENSNNILTSVDSDEPPFKLRTPNDILSEA